MKHFLLFDVWFFVYILLFTGCTTDKNDGTSDDAVQTFEARGVVKSITPGKDYINIDHEEITGFMGAMSMFFFVPDTSVLGNVAVDDSVTFSLEVKAGRPGVSDIEVIRN